MNDKYIQEPEQHIEVTSTGFVFGPATVVRTCTLPKGQIVLQVKTNKEILTIRVTKNGWIHVEGPVPKGSTGPTGRKRPR